MPLIPDIFKKGLEGIFDQESENFEGFPDSFASAAERWATAFDNYAKIVVPPSTTNEAAKAAFKSMFMTINNSNGRIILPKCFSAYAQVLASGMQPAFTAIQPIGDPILDPVYVIGYSGGTSQACIQLIVSIVDTWMRTGVAVNNSSFISVNWN